MKDKAQPKVRYRFTLGEAEFAMLDTGHCRVERYRDLTAPCAVEVVIELTGEIRRGQMQALIPGLGPEMHPQAVIDFGAVTRHWPADRVRRR